MKRKLLLLPMFMLVLAACGTSSSETPSVSEPISEVPVTSEEPVSEDPITSEDPVTSEVPVTSEEPVTSDDVPPPPPSTSEEIPDEMTISQIRDIPLNSSGGLDQGQIKEVRTSGIVTTVARRASGSTYNVTIQDGNEAMLLYAIAEDKIAEFGQPGDELVVDGLLAPYKGLWELSAVKVVSKTEGTAVTPMALTSVAQDDLVGLDSVLVKIDGLSVIAGEVVADTDADNLTFKLGEDTIGGYLHYAIPEDVQAAIAAALVPEGDVDDKIDAMDTLTFTGVVDMNAGTYQLAITGPENFTNVTDGGEPAAPTEFDSVSEIRAGIKDASLAVGAVVNFEGVITSIDYNGILIQETNGGVVSAIALRGVTTPANYDVGNLVRGTGTIEIYNGLAQIASVGSTLTVEAATGPTQGSVEVTEALLGDANLVDNTNALIHGTGFLSETDVDLSGLTGTGANVTLKKGAETFAVRFDTRYNDQAAVKEILNALDVNFTLDILEGGAYLSWFNNPQSYLIDASKLIVRNTSGEVVAGTEPEEPVTGTPDLFISEWVEPASGNNKFIEIYNPLAEAVDLSTYTMKAFPNGAATASATLALTGTLAAGETIVIYNIQQVIITTEIPSTWISQSYPGLTDFNGDDTFGLFKNDVLIDLVGEIGVDPGTEWSGLDFLGASVQTKDSNWTRHGSITVPNATFTMAEWVVGPWDTHTLGTHTLVA